MPTIVCGHSLDAQSPRYLSKLNLSHNSTKLNLASPLLSPSFQLDDCRLDLAYRIQSDILNISYFASISKKIRARRKVRQGETVSHVHTRAAPLVTEAHRATELNRVGERESVQYASSHSTATTTEHQNLALNNSHKAGRFPNACTDRSIYLLVNNIVSNPRSTFSISCGGPSIFAT